MCFSPGWLQELLITGFPLKDEKREETMRMVGAKVDVPDPRNQDLVYARTAERLPLGMSGGPVLDAQGKCCGIFQGFIPTLEEVEQPLKEEEKEWLQKMGGKAGFIPSSAWWKFVEDADAELRTTPQ